MKLFTLYSIALMVYEVVTYNGNHDCVVDTKCLHLPEKPRCVSYGHCYRELRNACLVDFMESCNDEPYGIKISRSCSDAKIPTKEMCKEPPVNLNDCLLDGPKACYYNGICYDYVNKCKVARFIEHEKFTAKLAGKDGKSCADLNIPSKDLCNNQFMDVYSYEDESSSSNTDEDESSSSNTDEDESSEDKSIAGE